ncbi:hypothetical protein [Streptomyces sp. NPDC048277]|uniref:hypothetical protein n=1 Tax=Streptomyces sp. NPDC048277 TaxID=3155027 RepID=UPI0033C32EBF
MSGPRPTTREPHPAPGTAPDTAGDVIRWAAFSCALVPVVLLWYGTSPAGAAGTALGLAAVTAACRFLLRRSECAAARGTAHGTERRTGVRGGGRHTKGTTPVD